MKERIRNLLINGFKQSEIAGIVGCAPGYITQLVKDPEFAEAVNAAKIAMQSDKTEEEHIDLRYQNLEHKLLTSIEDGLCEASLGEKVRALEALNKRRMDTFTRKNPAANAGIVVHNNIVNLSLPHHAARALVPIVEVNTANEIVAIDNRPLAPMSAVGVKNLFQQIVTAKAEQQAILAEI